MQQHFDALRNAVVVAAKDEAERTIALAVIAIVEQVVNDFHRIANAKGAHAQS